MKEFFAQDSKTQDFSLKTDLEHKMDDWTESLKKVTLQAKLGTIYEKVERIKALAAWIADKSGLDNSMKIECHKGGLSLQSRPCERDGRRVRITSRASWEGFMPSQPEKTLLLQQR